MMTLSDAIRLGSMIRPQAFEWLFSDGGSCALGAALEATGTEYRANCFMEDAMNSMPAEWQMGATVCPACPACSSRILIITHLNDSHKWTREAIAAWLETVDQPTVEAVEHVAVEA
jgi:hypothetical protein